MRTTIAIVLSGVLTSPLLAQDNPSVKVLRIRETRIAWFDKELEKADGESFSSMDPKPGMELFLEITGKDMANASSHGKLEIKKAADDAGTDLKPPKKKEGVFSFGGDDSDEFKRIEDSDSFFADATKTGKGFRLKIMCGLAARKAEVIKTFEAVLPVLAGGELKSVSKKSVTSLYGKALDDPIFKGANLQVTVVDPKNRTGIFSQDAEEQARSVTIEFQGDLNAIEGVEVLNADGEDLVNSRMWSTSADTQTITYDLSEKLTDDMTLKVNVYVGLKKIDVPIKLADVKLP